MIPGVPPKMISPSWMSAIEISTLVELVTLAAAECTTVHMALHMAYGMWPVSKQPFKKGLVGSTFLLQSDWLLAVAVI